MNPIDDEEAQQVADRLQLYVFYIPLKGVYGKVTSPEGWEPYQVVLEQWYSSVRDSFFNTNTSSPISVWHGSQQKEYLQRKHTGLPSADDDNSKLSNTEKEALFDIIGKHLDFERYYQEKDTDGVDLGFEDNGGGSPDTRRTDCHLYDS